MVSKEKKRNPFFNRSFKTPFGPFVVLLYSIPFDNYVLLVLANLGVVIQPLKIFGANARNLLYLQREPYTATLLTRELLFSNHCIHSHSETNTLKKDARCTPHSSLVLVVPLNVLDSES